MSPPSDPSMGISDDRVREKTGHGWDHWFAVLDTFDVAANGHTAAARHLQEDHGVSAWYAQSITVRYELEKGLREPGERSKGFGFSAQKTMDVPVERAFAAWSSAEGMDGWFTSGAVVEFREGGRFSSADDDAWEYRTIVPDERIRLSWEHPKHPAGSVVEVRFEEKGPRKCTVRIQHEQLASRELVDELRPAWKWALRSLEQYLTTGEGLND